MLNIFAVITVSALLGIGQVLFKKAALAIDGGAFLTGIFNFWSIAAVALSATAAVLWVWVLQTMPLNVAYAFTSLAYVAVPLAAYLLLDEIVSVNYLVGCGLIMTGVLIANT